MAKFTAAQLKLRAKMSWPHPTVPNFYYDARTTREAFESCDIETNHIHRTHGEVKRQVRARAKRCQDGAWRATF